MLKICSNLNDLFKTMQVLDKALKSYKAFLNKQSGKSLISEQEEFFGKLLPTIEKEYADVLKYSGKHTVDNIPKIIKWCAQKGFLQQAVTLYTEWMPIFVIDKKLHKITYNAVCNLIFFFISNKFNKIFNDIIFICRNLNRNW